MNGSETICHDDFVMVNEPAPVQSVLPVKVQSPVKLFAAPAPVFPVRVNVLPEGEVEVTT